MQKKLLKNKGIKPTRVVTNGLASYEAAFKFLGLRHLQDVGGRKNNREECSHVPIRRRERKSQKFWSMINSQKMLQLMIKFTTTSIIDATLYLEAHSENPYKTFVRDGTAERLQLALKKVI